MSLLLLHGASGNAATWEPVLSRAGLSDATAWDLPGRGANPTPPADRVSALAASLAVKLAAGPPIVLVGHSLGGAVGLQLALDAPACLRGLVLVSSSARLRVHPAILAAVAAATPDAPFQLTAAFGPETPPAVIERYHGLARPTPPATALADWTACDHFDVRDRLDAVQTPVLVLYGEQDALTVPRFQRSLADALPDSEAVALPGVGHMLPWEAPEAFGDAVRGWAASR